MKFKQLLETILLEANTKDILMTKAGLNEYNANLLTNTFGKLAIKIFKKILDGAIKLNTERPDIYKMSGAYAYSGKTMRDKIIQYFNDRRSAIQDYFGGRNEMNSLRDYIRVGLNNNFTQIENLTIPEMISKAEEWHESMGIGDSVINYVENRPIILDFREDGIGFYWVDLEKNDCTEEKERMGHCATSAGRLYSLRSYKKIENDYTLNKSHLTASINSDGNLLQLKGPKNTKPGQEYHKYILPLLYYKIEENEYLIEGIGYEYNSKFDFKISDLQEDQIKKLYEDRPELFTGRQEIKLLRDIGLIEPKKFDLKFTLQFPIKDIEDYIRGEYIHVAERVLSGDTYELWNNSEYVDWQDAAKNELNSNNIEKIRELLKVDSNVDLVDAIEEYDVDDEIKNRIRWSMNDAESNDYEDYLYSTLKDTLGEYGRVIEMHDGGVIIEVDLEYLISKNRIDDSDLDELVERCGDYDDALCLFSELIGDGYIEKPRYDLDDRWYPTADTNNFNEILNDRLNEI